jgi:hypothetical protein
MTKAGIQQGNSKGLGRVMGSTTFFVYSSCNIPNWYSYTGTWN